MNFRLVLGFVVFCSGLMLAESNAAEYLNGIKWEEPPVIAPGVKNSDPPSDATVLFGGADLSQWKNGEIGRAHV